MSSDEKQSKAVVMKPPSGPLSIRQKGKLKKPAKTALEEEEFTKVHFICSHMHTHGYHLIE